MALVLTDPLQGLSIVNGVPQVTIPSGYTYMLPSGYIVARESRIIERVTNNGETEFIDLPLTSDDRKPLDGFFLTNAFAESFHSEYVQYDSEANSIRFAAQAHYTHVTITLMDMGDRFNRDARPCCDFVVLMHKDGRLAGKSEMIVCNLGSFNLVTMGDVQPNYRSTAGIILVDEDGVTPLAMQVMPWSNNVGGMLHYFGSPACGRLWTNKQIGALTFAPSKEKLLEIEKIKEQQMLHAPMQYSDFTKNTNVKDTVDHLLTMAHIDETEQVKADTEVLKRVKSALIVLEERRVAPKRFDFSDNGTTGRKVTVHYEHFAVVVTERVEDQLVIMINDAPVKRKGQFTARKIATDVAVHFHRKCEDDVQVEITTAGDLIITVGSAD